MSLETLSERVTHRLQEFGLVGAQTDHRVSSAPDARTIRYYTTLGLLDRPLIQGRQAHYGKRPALQLLAIKALQARALPLAQIQERLYGRSDAELESLLTSLVVPQGERSEPVRIMDWREIAIEPGLKLVAEAGWSQGLPEPVLEKRIRAALAALQKTPLEGKERILP
ncbi:MAG: MerR family transcriptional regulator [Armatimonadetes bacterium]|nr:MerR family transcriptional regulator [Armatimonadota bacterium]